MPLVSEGSDLFVCKVDDHLNLDDAAFKSYEDVSDVSDSESTCVVSTSSGGIKGKVARIETDDENKAVKIYVKHKSPITLKNDEQVILQCAGGLYA